MKSPLCGRADLIRALADPLPDLLPGMARLLGFVPLLKPATVSHNAFFSATAEAYPTIPDQPQPTPTIPFWRVTACEFRAPLPAATETTIPAPKPWSGQRDTPPQSEPLATWPQLQPWLRRAGMAQVAGREVDIAQAVHRLGRGEWLARLPRRVRPVWGEAVQIIVDRSERLTPYWHDQLQVLAWLRGLFPVVEIALYWDGMAAPVMERGADRGYRPPAPGSLVLVLGDLGTFADAAEQRVWQRLGTRLHDCRRLALLPTAQAQRVAGWQTLAWERGNPQRAEAAQLLTLLAPAVRIEPGLLRAVRRWQNWDAGLEAALWQHPALVSTSSVAATLEPEQAPEYRAQFDALPAATRRQLLELLSRWRRHLPFEIWIEECLLNPGIPPLLEDDPTFHAWLQEAEDFITRLSQNAARPGVATWYRRVTRRIAAHADLPARPALDRLWHAAHAGEENAVAPAGYDPANVPAPVLPSALTLHVWQNAAGLVFTEDRTGHHGSWLGSLVTRSREISVEAETPFWEGEAPSWASAWGRDEYGLWVEFVIPGAEALPRHPGLAALPPEPAAEPPGSGIQAEPGRQKKITQRLRWIPAGTFLMGSPDSEAGRSSNEGPQHQVSLSEGFWLFDTAVTQNLWQTVTSENPSHFKGAEHPVETVSWRDCQRFIEKLNIRLPGLDLSLPTEAQWEYACRAGTRMPFSFGADITPEQVNYDGNFPYSGKEKGLFREKTVSVKELPGNNWGLYQMHGNVWEWCQDYFSNYFKKAQIDPAGPTDGTRQVVRGGSWGFDALGVRAAYRRGYNPAYRDADLGFRCARSQTGAKPSQEKPVLSAEAVAERAPPRTEQGGAAVLHWRDDGDNRLAWPQAPAFLLRSDSNRLEIRSLDKPAWADAIGRDAYGLWAEFGLEEVTQRLRWIPPGRFWMGSPESEAGRWDDEGPQHQVTLTQGFWLFDTAVTQALWEAVTGENPSHFKGADRPVERVSWDDCQAFLEKINRRLPGLALCLPTEAQWEYACRAGTQTPFSFGDNITPAQVNYDGNYPYADGGKGLYRQETVAVKALPCNAWGLYQMHGNVWEWCEDCWSRYSAEVQFDPSGPADDSRRVIRGGAWDDDARYVRAACRLAGGFGDRSGDLGLRCARVQSVSTPGPEAGGGRG